MNNLPGKLGMAAPQREWQPEQGAHHNRYLRAREIFRPLEKNRCYLSADECRGLAPRSVTFASGSLVAYGVPSGPPGNYALFLPPIFKD
jgi:hypothetical protein